MSCSKRETKLKKQEKQNFTLYALQGLHIALASRQTQEFIPRAISHAFPLTNPRHSLLSWTILLACLTSKPLFFKHSFTISSHLFRGLPAERLLLHKLSYPSPSSPHGRTTRARLHQSFHLAPYSLRITPLFMNSGPYPSS